MCIRSITIASEISSSYGKRPICVCVTKETIIITKMAFTGTYKLQKTEFYNEYLKALSKYQIYVLIFDTIICRFAHAR